jgi:hypothetical protein
LSKLEHCDDLLTGQRVLKLLKKNSKCYFFFEFVVTFFFPCTADKHFTTLDQQNAQTLFLCDDTVTPNIATCFDPQRITIGEKVASNIA